MIPKFRAWLKKEKKMVEVKSIHLSTKKVMYGYSINSQSYGNRSIKFDEVELMQYTGVKDKNGKEVYEGDIVQLFGGNKYIIRWNNQIACFDIVNDFGYLVFCLNNDFEVIGNIYENPELLEVE